MRLSRRANARSCAVSSITCCTALRPAFHGRPSAGPEGIVPPVAPGQDPSERRLSERPPRRRSEAMFRRGPGVGDLSMDGDVGSSTREAELFSTWTRPATTSPRRRQTAGEDAVPSSLRSGRKYGVACLICTQKSALGRLQCVALQHQDHRPAGKRPGRRARCGVVRQSGWRRLG